MEDCLRGLWAEARELTSSAAAATEADYGDYCRVERLDSPPSPLCFLRDFVSPNRPCIISSAATSGWPALSLWARDDSYLCSSLASVTVSVHLTPDGRADALHPLCPSSSDQDSEEMCFASACVLSMPFPDALRLIEASGDPSSPNVAYAQQQDDCLRGEYAAIAGDVEAHIPWATEALGCLPEAVNLWIGNARSHTSFHKDHYENLYAVITGQKHFLLLPPTDLHRLYVRTYPAAKYTTTAGDHRGHCMELKLELEEPRREVPWCSIDPYPPKPQALKKQRSEFPLYFDPNTPRPFCCTVNAGEILYLPSMWFHHVRQTPDSNGRTIAANYWYDMQFDIKYAYFNFLQSIQLPHPKRLAAAAKLRHQLNEQSDGDNIDDREWKHNA